MIAKYIAIKAPVKRNKGINSKMLDIEKFIPSHLNETE